MIKRLILVLSFVFPLLVQADLNSNLINLNKEEVIIDPAIVEAVAWETPQFPPRKSEIDLTRHIATHESQEGEWQGQLSVLKEIPYSYPQLSDRILQLRTLSELEGTKTEILQSPEEEAYTTD